jgi:hypothetical protein
MKTSVRCPVTTMCSRSGQSSLISLMRFAKFVRQMIARARESLRMKLISRPLYIVLKGTATAPSFCMPKKL